MMSIQQARNLVFENQMVISGVKSVSLKNSLNETLAKDVLSEYDHPFFNQSAVDGYAFKFSEYNQSLEVVSEVAAGGFESPQLKESQCYRIYTGAPVPADADTVVMQEKVELLNGRIQVKDVGIKKGGNIRLKGEQIKSGKVALVKGSKLTPAAIGYLASIGINEVKVLNPKPISILVSGNEFAKSKDDFSGGKIFESNGILLSNYLKELGLESSSINVPDTLEDSVNRIKVAEKESDVIIITGGVSVGDYDFTRKALEENGYEIVFHKVAQKPGKPMLFAKKGGKFVFGLPGNPKAVLMCYLLYVKPFIQKSLGIKEDLILDLPLGQEVKIKGGRSLLEPIGISNGFAYIEKDKGSHMLCATALTKYVGLFNAEVRTEFKEGDLIPVIIG